MNETILKAVTINSHSSIRIAVPDWPVIYVDPFHIKGEPRDADLILVTHPHFDHFSEEDIAKLAETFAAFQAGTLEAVKGFCAVAAPLASRVSRFSSPFPP